MNQVVKQSNGALAESVLIKGDLSQLTEEQRTTYYMRVCESVGLNPLTKPFEYITLNDKLTLYAKRDATDQLRKVNGVSLSIKAREKIDDIYIVTANAKTPDGREDESTGAVSLTKEDGEWTVSQGGKRYFKKNGNIIPLRGDELANAMMRAETKSKRRVTLSICGLGMLDETELETIPAEAVQPPAKSYFKNASLRNKFVENVIKAFECDTMNDLNIAVESYTAQFEEIESTGNEHDKLAIEECRRRYRAAKMRIQQDEINRASFGDGFVETITSDRPEALPSALPEGQEVPAFFRRVNV